MPGWPSNDSKDQDARADQCRLDPASLIASRRRQRGISKRRIRTPSIGFWAVQLGDLLVQKPKRNLQLFPVTWMNGSCQFPQDARARKLKIATRLFSCLRLPIIATCRKGMRCRGGFLLRLDGFAFPPPSHVLSLPRKRPEITRYLVARPLLYSAVTIWWCKEDL